MSPPVFPQSPSHVPNNMQHKADMDNMEHKAAMDNMKHKAENGNHHLGNKEEGELVLIT